MKKCLFSAVPFLLWIGCICAYNAIGAHIAPDGTLVEPFFLIPLGYLFFALGIIYSTVTAVKSLVRKPMHTKPFR